MRKMKKKILNRNNVFQKLGRRLSKHGVLVREIKPKYYHIKKDQSMFLNRQWKQEVLDIENRE